MAPVGPPAVLSAAWLNEGASDDEDAEAANGAAEGAGVASTLDESLLDASDKHAEEQQAAKARLTLEQVARIKEGATAFKSFLSESSPDPASATRTQATLLERMLAEREATTPISEEVKARVKSKDLPTLRLMQFRAYKAIRKLAVTSESLTTDGSSTNEWVVVLNKAQSVAEKYVQPLPWMRGYYRQDGDGGAGAAGSSTALVPAGDSMLVTKTCHGCGIKTGGNGHLIGTTVDTDYDAWLCTPCFGSRITPVARWEQPGGNCSRCMTDEDVKLIKHPLGRSWIRCDRCFKHEREDEGTCGSCKAMTNSGQRHRGEPDKLLCTSCWGKAEEKRDHARKYNPIGHPLAASSVGGASMREARGDALDVLLERITGLQSNRTPIAIKNMVDRSAWETLETFLAAELEPSFRAFKRTEAWASFDFDPNAGGAAADDATTALSTLNDAGGASSSASGSADDAAKPTEPEEQGASAADSFADYVPQKLTYGPAHVEHVVESASLACVSPTDVTLDLSLPEEAKTSGVLSRVQLEAVVYALQQHEKILPSGSRAGFFIGDGTGVGKGRELAAIVWNNWLRSPTTGRRAVWFTCNTDLAVDARRDLDDIGAVDVPLLSLTSLNYGRIDKTFKEGVLLVTYSVLVAKSGGKTRFDQIIEWLQPLGAAGRYEGVLAFDEAHKAKGAAFDQPVGKAVVDLQAQLPGARVVYLSATGATQVQDMSYMVRLGLWGVGTYFRDFAAIQAVLGASGSSGAMEMLAVQLKSSGAYLARSLGLRGVDFHLAQAKLSSAQEQLYDKCAKLWISIHDDLDNLATRGEGPPGWAGTYTSAQTKFFQQLVLSFKVGEITKATRKALRAGKCVVIGLQSTGDSAVKEALAKAEARANASAAAGAAGAASSDASGGGKATTTALVSAAREVVEGLLTTLGERHAQKATTSSTYGFDTFKRGVEAKLDRLALPPAALDELVNYFGVENVAEMTGRSKRLLKRPDGFYGHVSRAERGVPLAKVNLLERARFQRGEKLIAILSDAGATGVSLHADQKQANQRKRLHIVPELGWSATKIVQQFGRTHRTNQLMPPEYMLLTCECAGESLTGSSVARKLEGLGALTKGDKTAGRGETGGLGTNLETRTGNEALQRLKESLLYNVDSYNLDSIRLDFAEAQLIRRADTVKQFLTCIQLIKFKAQQSVLRTFISKIQREDDAMASQLESTSIRVVAERVVAKNPKNDAEKVTVTEIECNHGCSWEHALKLATDADALSNTNLVGFWIPRKEPWNIFLVLPHNGACGKAVAPHRVSAGSVWYSRLTENSCRNFNKLCPKAAACSEAQAAKIMAHMKKAWERKLAEAVKFGRHLEKFALLNGSVFSIWYNVRKAMDPAYVPDLQSAASMEAEATGNVGRSRGNRNRGYTFEPNVKIQLITTSDGKKLGGIRLSTFRPLEHMKLPFLPQCNKARAKDMATANFTICRKHCCLVEGLNEVDKLEKSLEIYERDLN